MDEQDGCDVPDRNKADDRRLKHSGCTYRFPRLDIKQNPLYEDSDLPSWILIITAVSRNING